MTLHRWEHGPITVEWRRGSGDVIVVLRPPGILRSMYPNGVRLPLPYADFRALVGAAVDVTCDIDRMGGPA